ncbi:MAG: YqjK-like family protein [Sulfuricaulis sp.]|uniref:YqjK-like family protein n=1 Tax=Sulfuricaulis sp. TaxID=2003553 RepID=UPI003C689773
MNTRLEQLTRRRVALVAQAAVQREEVGRLMQPWRATLALADHGIALVRTLRMLPLVIAVGVGFLVATRRNRLSAWIELIWIAWQFYSKLTAGVGKKNPEET